MESHKMKLFEVCDYGKIKISMKRSNDVYEKGRKTIIRTYSILGYNTYCGYMQFIVQSSLKLIIKNSGCIKPNYIV